MAETRLIVQPPLIPKVGRNSLCPCGSGKKFKRCHGSNHHSAASRPIPPNEVGQTITEAANEFQRLKQQGHGRPIVSHEVDGVRFVTVGVTTYHSSKWRTFHDFLFDYVKVFFDGDWFKNEKDVTEADRHPLVKWVELGMRFMSSHGEPMGNGINTIPLSGALMGLLDLSYSLFLLQHNGGIPTDLLRRLKSRKDFFGAHYELWIAGCMIKAGFELSHEDESDRTRSHCEFSAVFSQTGRVFSVEAKRRIENSRPETVGRLLKAALSKQADFTRIIVIEANVPAHANKADLTATMERVLRGLRDRETMEPFSDRAADAAYVIVTNSPYQHHLDTECDRWAIVEGYKIPDLKLNQQFISIREMVESRERHREVFALMDSFGRHHRIPITFDGQIPELEFGNVHARLLIGQHYVVPDNTTGKEIVAELISAAVVEGDAMCVMRGEDGINRIISCPLTEAEIAAYKRHPETFFGTVENAGLPSDARDPLDLYDFFLNGYSLTPKERLLELMAGHFDFDELSTLSQASLAKTYAERLTESAVWDGAFRHQELGDSKG